jgi:hypothetical protein
MHAYIRAIVWGIVAWALFYVAGLFVLAKHDDLLPWLASTLHAPLWIIEAWPVGLAILCLSKTLLNAAEMEGHRWACFLSAFWLATIFAVLPIGLAFALLPLHMTAIFQYPVLWAAVPTVPLWSVARRNAETVDELELFVWFVYPLMGAFSLMAIGGDVIQLAFPDMVLGKHGIFIAAAIGALLGLRACWRPKDRFPTLKVWFMPILIAGALVKLAYTTYRLDHFPALENLAHSTVPGSYYAFVAALFVMLWRYRPAGGTRGVKETILGIDGFFERANRVGDFSWFVVFRLGGAIAAVVGIYYMIHFEDWGQSLLKTTNGRPENPGLAILGLFLIFWQVRYVVISVLAVLAYFALLELWWLLIALVGKKQPLEDEKAHGKAGKATQAKAIDAARGGPQKPPWADHGYID